MTTEATTAGTDTGLGWTADEMMTVAAARHLKSAMSCFVGIGLPSVAANLARATHAPTLTLIYESGCLGARPTRLPLSIGDGILADTATAVITVPEVFNYWLQPGRIDIGFLAAAQLDRYANINTTVIGDYTTPTVRLPGAGGAPEIAASCQTGIIIVRQTTRTFVTTLDFTTSVGFGTGKGNREHLGLHGNGPQTVITDIGTLTPDPDTCELTLTTIHPGTTTHHAQTNTSWPLKISPNLHTTPEPTPHELRALRALTDA
jgi:glutaconate CoA-transferase subunit B